MLNVLFIHIHTPRTVSVMLKKSYVVCLRKGKNLFSPTNLHKMYCVVRLCTLNMDVMINFIRLCFVVLLSLDTSCFRNFNIYTIKCFLC